MQLPGADEHIVEAARKVGTPIRAMPPSSRRSIDLPTVVCLSVRPTSSLPRCESDPSRAGGSLLTDRLSSERRSRSMSGLRSKHTGIELAVQTGRPWHGGLALQEECPPTSRVPETSSSPGRKWWCSWMATSGTAGTCVAKCHRVCSTYCDEKIEARRRLPIPGTRSSCQKWDGLSLRVCGHEVLENVEGVADRIEELVRSSAPSATTKR